MLLSPTGKEDSKKREAPENHPSFGNLSELVYKTGGLIDYGKLLPIDKTSCFGREQEWEVEFLFHLSFLLLIGETWCFDRSVHKTLSDQNDRPPPLRCFKFLMISWAFRWPNGYNQGMDMNYGQQGLQNHAMAGPATNGMYAAGQQNGSVREQKLGLLCRVDMNFNSSITSACWLARFIQSSYHHHY